MDRINWVISDCLHAIALLPTARAHERAQPEALRARLREQVEEARRRAMEAGYSEREVRQIGYALAALADELAMQGDDAVAESWRAEPLQLAMFGDNLAGERFFEELELARKPFASDVVRTYYLCLAYGFCGRFAVSGAEAKLKALTESVRSQLAQALPAPDRLAPDGARPTQGLVDVTRRLPWPVLAASALALSVVLYLACRLSLREQLATFAPAGRVNVGAP